MQDVDGEPWDEATDAVTVTWLAEVEPITWLCVAWSVWSLSLRMEPHAIRVGQRLGVMIMVPLGRLAVMASLGQLQRPAGMPLGQLVRRAVMPLGQLQRRTEMVPLGQRLRRAVMPLGQLMRRAVMLLG